MGLIKKILDSAIARIQFNKIINLPEWIRRCYNIYIALGWFTLTDFDTEIYGTRLSLVAIIVLLALIPLCRRGVVVLYSTPTTVDVPDMSFGLHDDRSTAVWNLLVNL